MCYYKVKKIHPKTEFYIFTSCPSMQIHALILSEQIYYTTNIILITSKKIDNTIK